MPYTDDPEGTRMRSPNDFARATAGSELATGWSRISMILLVPILLGIGGWFATATITAGNERARLTERVAVNTEDIDRLSHRVNNMSTTLSAVTPQIAGLRRDVSEIKDILQRMAEYRWNQ